MKYVRLAQNESGELWLMTEDHEGTWLPYYHIKMLIEGNDLIINKTTTIMKVEE